MKKNEKGQGLVEAMIVIPWLLFVIMGLVAFAVAFHDYSQANSSAQAATHAAAIHIVDGSGKSCQQRALEALGNPAFLMMESQVFTISPCSTDPYWVGPSGQPVVGTWSFVVNPPLPFVYSNGLFPLVVELHFQDFFR